MKNKLKGFLLFMLVSLVAASPALALSWTWDLSSTGYVADGDFGSVTDGGTTVNFVNDLGAASSFGTYSIVNQSLSGLGGDDGILNDFDTFEEFGFLTILDADNRNLSFDTAGGDPALAYIAFSGLTGYITNYDNGPDGLDTTLDNYNGVPPAIADDSFELIFDPGVGSIGIYLDTDLDPTNGGTTLNIANFTLVAADGTSPEFILGEAEGQFGLIAGFTDVLNGVWQFEDGTYFEEIIAAYAPELAILMSSFNLGATYEGVTDDGTDLVFLITNEGSFQLSVVPEPSTFLLLGAGLIGIGFIARRKKH